MRDGQRYKFGLNFDGFNEAVSNMSDEELVDAGLVEARPLKRALLRGTPENSASFYLDGMEGSGMHPIVRAGFGMKRDHVHYRTDNDSS